MSNKPAIAVLLCCSTTLAMAWGDKTPVERGLWTGTLGNQAVVACFEPDRESKQASSGAYFYQRYKKPIKLEPREGTAASWSESSPQGVTGLWSLAASADRLDGTWADPQGKQIVALRLKRFKTLSDSLELTACAHVNDGVFNPKSNPQTRLEKPSPKLSSASGGKPIQRLSILGGAVTSLQLAGEEKGLAELNERLLNELSIGQSNYLSCPVPGWRQQAEKAGNAKPDYESSIELLFWSKRWVSLVKTEAGDCGGAYSFVGWTRSTWDLTSGEAVDPWAWIERSQKLERFIAEKAVKSRLAFNPKEAQENPNCLETLQSNTEYQITLSPKGLVFSHNFPHVTQACNDSIEIPYRQLLPFLTPEGQSAVSQLLAAAGK